MGLSHSPKVITNGLVFYMDQGNTQKSWKGAPATNLFTVTNLNNWSKSATTATSSHVTPHGDPAYDITDSNASGYSLIARDVTVANDSSSYTFSLFVKKTYGGTSAKLGFNSGFNTGGTQVAYNQRFNSDTGVANTGTVIDFGDWWYWYFTITNNSSGNTNLYCSFYPATGPYDSADNPSGVGTATIGGLMLVSGTTAVRFANGTRSNTQALLDLTSKNTITATSLTYAANGTFSFNGSNNMLIMSENSTFNTQNPTVEVLIKTNSLNQNGFFFEKGQVNTQYSLFQEGTNIVWRTHNGTLNSFDSQTIASSNINTSNYWHIVGTIENGNKKIYVNGQEKASVAWSNTIPTNANGCSIGVYGGFNGSRGYYLNGIIDSVKVYNRGLTQAEIQQNFNALRGRYGI